MCLAGFPSSALHNFTGQKIYFEVSVVLFIVQLYCIAWFHRCFLLVAFFLVVHVASGLFTKRVLEADSLQLG